MPRSYKTNSLGDRVEFYSLEELIQMYLDEGKDDEEAICLAEALYSELKTLNHQTKNIWNRSKNR